MPGGDERDGVRRDPAEARLDRDRAAVAHLDAGHLAALDEVDAERVGGARVAPGDVLVAGDPAARLVGRAEHRVAHVGRDVEDRAELADRVRLEPLGVDAVEPVRAHAPHAVADVLQRVRQVEHAALAEEQVVVELRLEPLPQLQRVLVDRGALVPEVVRADDRRVARDVPAGEPAALEHGDVGDAVLLREVVGGREPVPAAADDHDLVRVARLRAAPEEVGVLAAHGSPRRCAWPNGHVRAGHGRSAARVTHLPPLCDRA